MSSNNNSTAGELSNQFVEAWKYRAIGSGEWRVTLNEQWAKSLDQSEVIPLYSQKSMQMASGKAMSKVFKGADGLKKLADADAFWEQQPYGTRFYFGDGIADYLHREVLRAAVSDISAAPKLEIERLRDQQAERVMPMIGPLLDAFQGTQRGDLEDVYPFLSHWLNKINQAMVSEECSDCEGTGMRDSGGVQPWGESINVPCDCGNTTASISHQPEGISMQKSPFLCLPANWIVKHYAGAESPIVKSSGIELECAGADREQAEAIAAILNSFASGANLEILLQMGFAIAPKIPTEEMLHAALSFREVDANDEIRDPWLQQYDRVYRAMIAAVPACQEGK